MLEKYSASAKRPRERPEKLVALADKYEADLKLMRELYKKADGVEEVAVKKVRAVLDWVWLAWLGLAWIGLEWLGLSFPVVWSRFVAVSDKKNSVPFFLFLASSTHPLSCMYLAFVVR